MQPTLSLLSRESPQPCLSPLAERLKASLPSQALRWPCGQPTCTGQCQLCGVNLRTGHFLLPQQPRNPQRSYVSPNPEGYLRLTYHGIRDAIHRVVYEIASDLPIPPGYDIHHRDGNVTHNCPSNLQALPHHVHAFISLQSLPLLSYCKFCQMPFRTRATGHDDLCKNHLKTFCSKHCYARSRYGWNPPPPISAYSIFTRSTVPSLATPDSLSLRYVQPSFSFI